jgi:hypothetical protein
VYVTKPHNAYLSYAYGAGIPALLAFLALSALGAWQAAKCFAPRRKRAGGAPSGSAAQQAAQQAGQPAALRASQPGVPDEPIPAQQAGPSAAQPAALRTAQPAVRRAAPQAARAAGQPAVPALKAPPPADPAALRAAACFFTGWLAYLVQALVNDDLLSTAPIWWALFGIACGIARAAQPGGAWRAGREG